MFPVKIRKIGIPISNLPFNSLRIIFSYLTPYEYYCIVSRTCTEWNYFWNDIILLNEYNKQHYKQFDRKKELISLTNPIQLSFKQKDIIKRSRMNGFLKMKTTLLFKEYKKCIQWGLDKCANGILLRSSKHPKVLEKIWGGDMNTKGILRIEKNEKEKYDLIQRIYNDLKFHGLTSSKLILKSFKNYLYNDGFYSHNIYIYIDPNLFRFCIFWNCSVDPKEFFQTLEKDL